jgi:phosphoglycolate phosphatase
MVTATLPAVDPVDLVICDLDGTLVDSAPGIVHAAQVVLTEFGLATPADQTVRDHIGGGARNLIRSLLGVDQAALLEAVLERFTVYYNDNALFGSNLYPQVKETLDYLHRHGVWLGLATAKSRAATDVVLEYWGIAEYFDQVVSITEMARPKPDPGCVTTILTKLGADRARTIMVGDTSTDLRTALNAGVRAWAVTYGYGRAGIEALGGYEVLTDDFATLRSLR